jgi:ribose transport system ATP-binding protein
VKVIEPKAPAIEVVSVSKRYEATIALDDVSISINEGEIHALLGENGAGKSTIVKILSGLVQADSGTIKVHGTPVKLSTPQVAHRLGIQTAYQEMSLIPDLTVSQNMLLPYEPVNALGFLNAREADKLVKEQLREYKLDDVSPYIEVKNLDLATRQKVEITRAIVRKPRILLLDEPTSALLASDVTWLGEIIARLRDDGVAIIFISHRLAEIRRYCEKITILRNGKHIATFKTDDCSDEEVVRLVIGRSLDAAFPVKPARTSNEGKAPAFSCRNLRLQPHLKGVSFDLWPGEVLGIAALQGMGQVELFHALFGNIVVDEGIINRNGRAITLASPVDAIRTGIGISMVPQDRKTEGVFPELPGSVNVSLPILKRFSHLGWLNIKAERSAVDRVLSRLNVHPRALYKAVGSFSGGNQQKISIAKWLITGSQVMLMLDPTRGVDVGTKYEIYTLVGELAREGGSILFYSTEVPELVGLCTRVLVMYQGAIVAALAGDDLTEENVMRAALGNASPAVESESGGR